MGIFRLFSKISIRFLITFAAIGWVFFGPVFSCAVDSELAEEAEQLAQNAIDAAAQQPPYSPDEANNVLAEAAELLPEWQDGSPELWAEYFPELPEGLHIESAGTEILPSEPIDQGVVTHSRTVSIEIQASGPIVGPDEELPEVPEIDPEDLLTESPTTAAGRAMAWLLEIDARPDIEVTEMSMTSYGSITAKINAWFRNETPELEPEIGIGESSNNG